MATFPDSPCTCGHTRDQHEDRGWQKLRGACELCSCDVFDHDWRPTAPKPELSVDVRETVTKVAAARGISYDEALKVCIETLEAMITMKSTTPRS
jgi:hypothetical protein